MANAQLDPARADEQSLGRLRQALQRHGYSEERLGALLGRHVAYREAAFFPFYFDRVGKDKTPFGSLVRFWLFQLPMEREALNQLMGADVVNMLLNVGVVQEQAGRLASLCDLYPVDSPQKGENGPHFFFTDPRFAVFPEKVYHLGGDSYLLTHLGPEIPATRVLDLCTGSGVQAIAGGTAGERHLVDINPRAALFAQLNLQFNGQSGHSTVHLGSLWDPVADLTFDRITLNPPFVPAPAQGNAVLYQRGGNSGEEVTRIVLEGAEAHLQVGGILQVVTNAPERHDRTEVEKLRDWLGTTSPWGVVQLLRQRISPEAYISLMVPREEQHWLHGLEEGERQYHAEFRRWLEHYEDNGIKAMIEVVYLITKLPPGSLEWNVEHFIVEADHQRRQDTASWLQVLGRASGPDWARHRYVLSPGTFCGDATQLVVRSPLWGLACEQPGGEEVALARFLESPRGGDELLSWGSQRGLGSDEVWRLLACLSRLGAVTGLLTTDCRTGHEP